MICSPVIFVRRANLLYLSRITLSFDYFLRALSTLRACGPRKKCCRDIKKVSKKTVECQFGISISARRFVTVARRTHSRWSETLGRSSHCHGYFIYLCVGRLDEICTCVCVCASVHVHAYVCTEIMAITEAKNLITTRTNFCKGFS